jgi:nicotinamide phosphoribosyltransferase
MKKYLFKVPTLEEVQYWGSFWESHGLIFNYEGWNYISKLGYLPLRIIAPPEGSIVPSGEPMVTIESTDPQVPWLPGWVETVLLQLWYPTTVCTKSYRCKQVIKSWLEKTGGIEGLDFKLHDFGYRGVSSGESAGIGGAAHLVNFMGTDTSAGLIDAMFFYGAKGMPGFSIPASEHSTITSWGRESEEDAYDNMLTQFAKDGKLLACVSDSYDLTNAVLKLWGSSLKQKVIDSGATLVIRPDSGDPATVLVRTLQEIASVFGSTINDEGFLVLPDCVRVIQGDGIGTPEDIDGILEAVADAGFSAGNVAFGMGGGLLQLVNRDTYKFAMKMSAIKRSGVWQGVSKNPKDAPWKSSKEGRLKVDNGSVVFFNGELTKEITFEEVRANG